MPRNEKLCIDILRFVDERCAGGTYPAIVIDGFSDDDVFREAQLIRDDGLADGYHHTSDGTRFTRLTAAGHAHLKAHDAAQGSFLVRRHHYFTQTPQGRAVAWTVGLLVGAAGLYAIFKPDGKGDQAKQVQANQAQGNHAEGDFVQGDKIVIQAPAAPAESKSTPYDWMRKIGEEPEKKKSAFDWMRSPAGLPNIAGLVPKRDVATRAPKTKPTDVTLTVDNQTGKSLALFLFDCDAFYTNQDSKQPRAEFHHIDLKPGKTPFDKFVAGSGYHLLFVADDKHTIQLLPGQASDLFHGPDPMLTIEAGNQPPYKGTLRFPRVPTVK